MLDYKDILTKRYALGMSGLAIAKSLGVSVSCICQSKNRSSAHRKVGHSRRGEAPATQMRAQTPKEDRFSAVIENQVR